MIVVADASAVASFLLPDEGGLIADFARAVCAANDVHVPQHWTVEIARVIWKARRRNRIDDHAAIMIGTAAAAIGATATVVPEASIGTVTSTALRLGLTTYDASYYLLAMRLGGSLLTTDGALSRAAKAEGIEILAP